MELTGVMGDMACDTPSSDSFGNLAIILQIQGHSDELNASTCLKIFGTVTSTMSEHAVGV